MKMYHDRETTPLKFHKFYRCIYLPYEIYLIFTSISSIISDIEYFHISYVISLAYNLTVLICIIICLVGIKEWKLYAWKALITYRIILIGYDALVLWVTFVLSPRHIPAQIRSFLSGLTTSVPILIYYLKRRNLFLPQDTTQIPDAKSYPCPTCEKIVSREVSICPFCGAVLH